MTGSGRKGRLRCPLRPTPQAQRPPHDNRPRPRHLPRRSRRPTRPPTPRAPPSCGTAPARGWQHGGPPAPRHKSFSGFETARSASGSHIPRRPSTTASRSAAPATSHRPNQPSSRWRWRAASRRAHGSPLQRTSARTYRECTWCRRKHRRAKQPRGAAWSTSGRPTTSASSAAVATRRYRTSAGSRVGAIGPSPSTSNRASTKSASTRTRGGS